MDSFFPLPFRNILPVALIKAPKETSSSTDTFGQFPNLDLLPHMSDVLLTYVAKLSGKAQLYIKLIIFPFLSSGRTTSLIWGFKIRHTTFLNFRKLADFLIVRL